jgi:hypothetical protein
MSTYQGNVKFRELIHQRQEEYTNASRRQAKDRIAREILAVVAERKGRFLRKVESGSEEQSLGVPEGVTAWVEADEAVAVEKVKQALRHREQSQSRSATLPTHSRFERTSQVAAPSAASLALTLPHKPTSLLAAPQPHMTGSVTSDLTLQLLAESQFPLFVSQPVSRLSLLQRNHLEQQLQLQQQFQDHRASIMLGGHVQELLQAQQLSDHMHQQQVLHAAITATAGPIPMNRELPFNSSTPGSLGSISDWSNAEWNSSATSAVNPPFLGVRGGPARTNNPTGSDAQGHGATSLFSQGQSGIYAQDGTTRHAGIESIPTGTGMLRVTAEALDAPSAGNQAFLVKDRSTTDLLRMQQEIALELLSRGNGSEQRRPRRALSERRSSADSTGDDKNNSRSQSSDEDEEDRKPSSQKRVKADIDLVNA